MRANELAVLTGASAIVVAFCAACTAEGGDSSLGSGTGGSPAATPHAFRGTYEVPVTSELASAAVYDVPEVEWTITNGIAKLDYELPLGLVGKSIRVDFTGPVPNTASGPATLEGAAGTAKCDLSSATVACNEVMTGLLPIEPDYAVIEQIAGAEYAGPASQRLDVAKQFSVDPIGIVHVDLAAPVVEPPQTEGPED